VWEAAERALKELVRKMPDTRLRLLLVSGWRMIGCEKAHGILYEELASKQAPFELEVLLLRPDGEAAKTRADSLNLTHEQYRKGVEAVLWTLAHWKRSRNLKVSAFLYDEEPIWQMVISRLEIWLLCATKNIPTGRSPIYCLRRDAEYGLAVGFKAVWERRRSLGKPVDFDTIVEPDWNVLKDVVEMRQ
jgi:hypothetical protein